MKLVDIPNYISFDGRLIKQRAEQLWKITKKYILSTRPYKPNQKGAQSVAKNRK